MATQHTTDNLGEGLVEVTYLPIDPASVSDAIDLDEVSLKALGELKSKQNKWFWGMIGAFALLSALAVGTQNGLLTFTTGIGFILLLRLGWSIMGQNPKIGLSMIGSAIAIIGISLFVSYLVQPPKPENSGSDGGAYVKSLRKENDDSYTCPHCNGMGVRYNQIKGDIDKCASCGGDGKVTSEQYDRLSK